MRQINQWPKPGFTILALALTLALAFFSSSSSAAEIKLTESEVIKLALENNPEIKLALADYQIASAEAEASLMDLDSYLTVLPSYKQDTQLPNSTLDAVSYKETTSGVSLGLKKKFSYGTQGELTYQELRLTTGSQQALLTDRKQGAAQAKLTQPLLKGGGTDHNLAMHRKAHWKKKRYYWNLIEAIDKKLNQSIGFYWDLKASEKEVEIKKAAVQYYQDKLEMAKEKLQAGRGSRIDVLQAQSDHSLKKAELILAKARRDDTEEKLLREIRPYIGPSHLETASMTGSEDQNLETLQISVNPDDALEKNSRLKKIRMEQKEVETDLLKARNNKLPQLDLSVQWTQTGMGNSEAESRKMISNGQYPGWGVTLQFSIPFGNEAGSGNLNKEKATYHLKELTLSKEEKLLIGKLSRHQDNLHLLKVKLSSLKSQLENQMTILNFKEQAFSAGRVSYIELKKENEKLQTLQFKTEDTLADLAKESIALQVTTGQLALDHKQAFLKNHGIWSPGLPQLSGSVSPRLHQFH